MFQGLSKDHIIYGIIPIHLHIGSQKTGHRHHVNIHLSPFSFWTEKLCAGAPSSFPDMYLMGFWPLSGYGKEGRSWKHSSSVAC